MKVFIVQAGNDGYHEQYEVIAACASKKIAEEKKAEYEKRKCDHENCDYKFSAFIFEMTVTEEAKQTQKNCLDRFEFADHCKID